MVKIYAIIIIRRIRMFLASHPPGFYLSQEVVAVNLTTEGVT
jgi:hypothetical protein